MCIPDIVGSEDIDRGEQRPLGELDESSALCLAVGEAIEENYYLDGRLVEVNLAITPQKKEEVMGAVINVDVVVDQSPQDHGLHPLVGDLTSELDHSSSRRRHVCSVCGSWSGKHRVEILCLYTITVSVFGKFPKG